MHYFIINSLVFKYQTQFSFFFLKNTYSYIVNLNDKQIKFIFYDNINTFSTFSECMKQIRIRYNIHKNWNPYNFEFSMRLKHRYNF